MFLKKLILVVSPPACGKTYVSKKLAENLKNVVYLDKDTLIPLSKKIFEAANEEYNRSSDFFNRVIRDVEYEVVLDLAFEALEYADMVLINAPFTREIRDLEYVKSLSDKLATLNCELDFIWVSASPETCHERMILRNSTRDTWKLVNWDEYIKGVNFSIPEPLASKESGSRLIIFDNDSNEKFDEVMKDVVSQLEN